MTGTMEAANDKRHDKPVSIASLTRQRKHDTRHDTTRQPEIASKAGRGVSMYATLVSAMIAAGDLEKKCPESYWDVCKNESGSFDVVEFQKPTT